MPSVRLKTKTANGVSARWVNEVAIPFNSDDCLMWPFHRNQLGRPLIHIEGRNRYANQLICERVHGPRPSQRHVSAHSCGNGHEACVNPRHLRWATFQENSEDMVAHGRATRGARNTQAKLTEDAVLELRRLACSGIPQKELAARFGVSKANVCLIVNGKAWSWLTSA